MERQGFTRYARATRPRFAGGHGLNRRLTDEVDPSQLGGVGGGTPVTSKTAILSRSDADGVDIDYLFAQVSFERPFVDTNPSCGNILSAVGHACLEMGLVEANDPITRITIRNTNTGSLMEAVVETPGGQWNYLGDARIDGVAGSAAPVIMNFLDVVGSKTGQMYPTGKTREEINGLTVTLIDVAVPMIWFKAEELGLKGNETKAELDNPELLARMEACRLIASERMGLGDARGKVVPKMGIASAPIMVVMSPVDILCRKIVTQPMLSRAALTSRLLPPSLAQLSTMYQQPTISAPQTFVLEHPLGSIDVALTYSDGNDPEFQKAGVVRTAKKIMAGEIFVPKAIF